LGCLPEIGLTCPVDLLQTSSIKGLSQDVPDDRVKPIERVTINVKQMGVEQSDYIIIGCKPEKVAREQR